MMLDCTYASVKKMVRKVCKSRGALAVEKALPALGPDLAPCALVEAIAGSLHHDAMRPGRQSRRCRALRRATGPALLAALHVSSPASQPAILSLLPHPCPPLFTSFFAQVLCTGCAVGGLEARCALRARCPSPLRLSCLVEWCWAGMMPEQCKLVVIDHVTSNEALRLPLHLLVPL